MFDKMEVIKKFYDPAFIGPIWFSFQAGGDENAFQYFDPDFTWVTAHNGWNFKGSPYIGMKNVFNNVFVNAAADFDPEHYRVDVSEYIDASADVAIVLGHYTSKSVRSGEWHRIQVAHVWTFKNNRAREFRQYTNTYHMMNFDACEG